LRRGSDANKQAILYEVIAENTSEERTSARRHGERQPPKIVPPSRQLGIVYGGESGYATPKAAERSDDW
jgi:hypothetical protein